MKSAMNVRRFLAGILAGTMSPSLKSKNDLGSFQQKVQSCLTFGAPLRIMSLDLEALPLGNVQWPTDKVLIVVGLQPWTFVKGKVIMGRKTQRMLDGLDAMELAKFVYDECRGFDAIIGHNTKWDVNVLLTEEPLLVRRFGKDFELPPAYIDIMMPYRGRGISAGQAHVCDHYALGTAKSSVNIEIWQDAVVGELHGLSKAKVLELRRRIRDDRNSHCLDENLMEAIFWSENVTRLAKITTRETYPARAKVEAILA